MVQRPMVNCHMLQLRWSQDAGESKLTTGECFVTALNECRCQWVEKFPPPPSAERGRRFLPVFPFLGDHAPQVRKKFFYHTNPILLAMLIPKLTAPSPAER